MPTTSRAHRAFLLGIPRQPDFEMLLRAILAFLALPTLVAGVVPLWISRTPAPATSRSATAIELASGWVFIAIGVGLLLVSVVSFYRRGRGTLAPWDPPSRLVVQDLYRFNRNPMYVGVLMVVLGWALLTGHLWNYVYAAILPIAFHLRVVTYEEKEMERLYGEEWRIYRKAVPRWGFRFRPRDRDFRGPGAE